MTEETKPEKFKRPVGHPLKFRTVEQLQTAIDDYFKDKGIIVTDAGIVLKPPTVTGLALHLGTYRQTICNYEQKDDYMDAIKTAKLKCENFAEEMLYLGKTPTGAIFALKNYGWSDKQDINLGGQNGQNPIETALTVNWVKSNGNKPT